MIILWLIWLGSLLSMAVIAFFAVRRVPAKAFGVAAGISVGDVIRGEVDIARDMFSRWIAAARPIVIRVTLHTIRFIRNTLSRVFTYLEERIYGKGSVENGSTVSFFVKRIREFKDEISRDDLR